MTSYNIRIFKNTTSKPGILELIFKYWQTKWQSLLGFTDFLHRIQGKDDRK